MFDPTRSMKQRRYSFSDYFYDPLAVRGAPFHKKMEELSTTVSRSQSDLITLNLRCGRGDPCSVGQTACLLHGVARPVLSRGRLCCP